MKVNPPPIRAETFLDPVFDAFSLALRNIVTISKIASSVFDVIGRVFQTISDLVNDFIEWFE